MKNQKGFIQIPLLIAIIAGVLVLGGGGYFGVKQYQSYQVEKVKEKKILQEKEKGAQVTAETQQKALEQAQAEIEKLKQDSESAKVKQQQLEQTIKSAPKPVTPTSQDISSADLQPYLNTIGVISCFDADSNRYYGTGVLLKSGELMTNWHVVNGMNACYFVNDKFINPKYEVTGMNYRAGAYILDLQRIERPDGKLDFVIVPFHKNPSDIPQKYYGAPADEYLEVGQLNYKVGSMSKCSTKVAVGT